MEIIITEEQKNFLQNVMVNESADYCDKILKIKQYLDKKFIKGNSQDGQVIIMVDTNKKPLQVMSDKEGFEHLQSNFPDIVAKIDRDNFLTKCLLAWYEDRITPEGVILLHKH